MLEPVPDGFTSETGHRTFAINELMVVAQARRQGVATALHQTILGGRDENRATLLVEQDNKIAQAAYINWGWQQVGLLKPLADSPEFISMTRDLPLR